MPGTLSPADVNASQAGGRRGASVKTLKKMLKKAGLKTTGRKAALTRRAKKAHLKMRGGEEETKEEGMVPAPPAPMGAGRHGRSRRR